MRQLPILFSTPMVEAILEGRKTMTRRTAGLENMNDRPEKWVYNDKLVPAFSFNKIESGIIESGKPRYNVGDQLWVKETFSFAPSPEETKPFYPKLSDYIYKAASNYLYIKWRPSLFMPKEAARLWLEITDVSCERLQLISHTDAIAEGIKFMHGIEFTKHYNYVEKEFTLRYPSHSFFSLWRSINGKDSVAANPWVFVYTFKRIEKP